MSFGEWSIDKELFDKITEILPKDKTILELGSGSGTQDLASYGYKMYSVEHNPSFLYLYNTQYIYSPLVNGWYDPDRLVFPLYDLLLIDGPDSHCRNIMLLNIGRFNLNVPIVFDDSDNASVIQLWSHIQSLVNRKTVFYTGKTKQFGVIL